MAPVRILIADDHPLVRSGLRALLAATEDVEVVGEAATGEEAVMLAASVQPEVIVMDLRMPGINGIEATRRIVQAHPQIRVLVVTLFEPPFSAARAALLPQLLEGDRYVVGLSLGNLSVQFGQVVGFVAGGALVGLLTVHGALLFDAVTFVASAAVVRWASPPPASG